MNATPLLTPRQQLVLNEIMRGGSNEQIAAALCIAINTVKIHKRDITERLHLDSGTESSLLAECYQREWLVWQPPWLPHPTSVPAHYLQQAIELVLQAAAQLTIDDLRRTTGQLLPQAHTPLTPSIPDGSL